MSVREPNAYDLDREEADLDRAAELAAGKPRPYHPRSISRQAELRGWALMGRIDDHRRQRRQLQAQLADERGAP